MTDSTILGGSAANDAPTDGGEDANNTAPARPETGTENATTEGSEESAKPDDAKPEVPEKYDFTPPDGFDVSADDLTGYEAIAKQAGLTQAQFEAVTKHGLEYFQRQLTAQHEAMHQRVTGWQSEVLGDRTLSDGEGLLPEVRQNADRVMQTYGGDDLREALSVTGAGNHPAIVKFINSIGKAMGVAGDFDRGKPASSATRDGSLEGMASRIYGQRN